MFKISVIKRFEYIAKKYPNNIAIITKEKKITYSVLNKDANCKTQNDLIKISI